MVLNGNFASLDEAIAAGMLLVKTCFLVKDERAVTRGKRSV
jgi:hypothetical protein